MPTSSPLFRRNSSVRRYTLSENRSRQQVVSFQRSHTRCRAIIVFRTRRRHTTDRETRSETHVARYRGRNIIDENERRNSSLITTCTRCGRRHRRRMSVKVYLGDRSYDDCRPTCSRRHDNRFLMKRTTHSIPTRDSKASKRIPEQLLCVVNSGMVMELPKRRLADIISHCEICIINFKFKYRTSLVSLIFVLLCHHERPRSFKPFIYK